MSITLVVSMAGAAVFGYLIGAARHSASRRRWIELAEQYRARDAERHGEPYKRLWPKGQEPL